MIGAHRLAPGFVWLARYTFGMTQRTSLAIGIAVGVALGLATENLFIGTGAGIVLSIALGYRGGEKKDD
ncbi:hypothetical protein FXN63_11830 [Pigmentiphaga aceris]|uniref:Glycine zipper-like domain-containing protein n=1 Tax=Pigmentiphaga aceris TaxID=1940612 RepID=A0A5C0AYH4_9BURK|nr:hypothetical protein [Pigmentiphaga aceris]QEI06443.1 hypothetical protein FXN63_11830 [Pigmentiphaga aceris]